MTETEEATAGRLPFDLYDWDDSELGKEIQALIDDDRLPFDTFFRLASIGQYQTDPLNPDGRWSLMFASMANLVSHVDDLDAMRPDVRSLIYGEQPDAIIDWWIRDNRHAYKDARFDPMYYRMGNLATVIKERRQQEEKTITEVRPGSWFDAKEQEWHRCLGLARPIWRVIVQRIHPEWLSNPEAYYAPTISFNQIYYPGDATQRKHIIGHAVISDTVVLKMYQEAVDTGVRGIGSVGREDLRVLLTDEHPELCKEPDITPMFANTGLEHDR